MGKDAIFIFCNETCWSEFMLEAMGGDIMGKRYCSYIEMKHFVLHSSC